MLTCANCGNQRPEGTRFCGICGTPFEQVDPEPPLAAPSPPPSPGRKRRRRWVAVGMVVALLVVGGGVAAAALSLTGGGDSTDAVSTSSAQTASSEADCLALGRVVADISVGANAGELVPIALDISPSDYLVDRDFLNSYSERAPAEVRADVSRLALFVDRYATAMQAAGLEPGSVPTGDQAGEIRAASQIGSVEQDQLPGSIEALGTWAANGCSGARPPTGTTPDASAVPTTGADTTAPGLLGATDEEVTAAVNYAMSQRTEWELGSSPLGAEVRNCRKDRDVSEDSLLAPGGRLYTCEVWSEGELWSDSGLAAIDSDGDVYVAP